MEIKEELKQLNEKISGLRVEEKIDLELKQLNESIGKLENFVKNRLNEVSEYHGKLLKKQLKAMKEYSKVLTLRWEDLQ
jgi:hypothetical protein